jgi:hypothetical protein
MQSIDFSCCFEAAVYPAPALTGRDTTPPTGGGVGPTNLLL